MDDNPDSAGNLDRGPALEPLEEVDGGELLIVERVPVGARTSGTGWRQDTFDTALPGSRWWERVLTANDDLSIVERVVRGDGDGPPAGQGWQLRTESGKWVERVLRDPRRELETNQDDDEEEPYERPRRAGSSVFNPDTGDHLRAVLTLGLTGAVVAVTVTGVAVRLPTEAFAAYVAPLLTLAGTALGYWFGSERR